MHFRKFYAKFHLLFGMNAEKNKTHVASIKNKQIKDHEQICYVKLLDLFKFQETMIFRKYKELYYMVLFYSILHSPCHIFVDIFHHP